MKLSNARHTLAGSVLAAVIATLMFFSGLAPAGAGTTIMGTPKVWPISERIDASGWAKASGIQNQSTSDVGGGRNVAYIHDGDWTEYFIAVAESGSYRVAVRVASPTTGGTIDMSVNGVPVGSVVVNGTHGLQNWSTMYTTVELDDAASALRLTYNGPGDELLFNVNWLEFENVNDLTEIPPQFVASPSEEGLRRFAVDEMVRALESQGHETGSYRVEGGGALGSAGHGWGYFEEAGTNYPVSTARVLTDAGHLPIDAPHDPAWVDVTSIAGDVLIYRCQDRVAVFTRDGDGQPSADDEAWWTSNECNRYPIDNLRATYYRVSMALYQPPA